MSRARLPVETPHAHDVADRLTHSSEGNGRVARGEDAVRAALSGFFEEMLLT